MVEVYKTNVKSESLSDELIKLLTSKYPKLKVNFDLEDFNKPYPCGHSVLRIEGKNIATQSIAKLIKEKGFECDPLEDKICI